MRYFTKEWHTLCQKTDLHLLLEESKEAESLSEEYFQRVYDEELNKFLLLQEDEFLKSDLSAEEIQTLKQNYATEREEASESYIPPESFDREEMIDQFTEAYFADIQHSKTLIPETILNEIADIRVFVLGRASRKVIEELKSFSENNQKIVNNTIKKYERYYKETYGDIDPIGNVNFHDCKIIQAFREKNEFTLMLDNSDGFTDIQSIKFINCEIPLREMPLENAWWLYDEIYKNGEKYELQTLMLNKNLDPFYFTIVFEKAVIE